MQRGVTNSQDCLHQARLLANILAFQDPKSEPLSLIPGCPDRVLCPLCKRNAAPKPAAG
jgi:hypothetical protein